MQRRKPSESNMAWLLKISIYSAFQAQIFWIGYCFKPAQLFWKRYLNTWKEFDVKLYGDLKILHLMFHREKMYLLGSALKRICPLLAAEVWIPVHIILGSHYAPYFFFYIISFFDSCIILPIIIWKQYVLC